MECTCQKAKESQFGKMKKSGNLAIKSHFFYGKTQLFNDCSALLFKG